MSKLWGLFKSTKGSNSYKDTKKDYEKNKVERIIDGLKLYKDVEYYNKTITEKIVKEIIDLGTTYISFSDQSKDALRKKNSLDIAMDSLKKLTPEELNVAIEKLAIDETLCNDVIAGLIYNYKTDPFSLVIPLSVSDPKAYINQHKSMIHQVYFRRDREVDKMIPNMSADSLMKNVYLGSLYSKHSYLDMYFILQNLYKNIRMYDKTNSIHYLLQDVINTNETHFFNCFISTLTQRSHLAIDKEYKDKVKNLQIF